MNKQKIPQTPGRTPDVGPAGCLANIEHYRAVWIQQRNQLELTERELAFWMACLQSHNLPPLEPDSVK